MSHHLAYSYSSLSSVNTDQCDVDDPMMSHHLTYSYSSLSSVNTDEFDVIIN